MAKNIPLEAMYQDIILEHQKDPRNYCTLKDPDRRAVGYNPLCGDRVCIELKLDAQNKAVQKTGFQGHSCSICKASASMMTEEIEGKSLNQIKSLIQNFRNIMQGEKDPDSIDGDLESLLGVRKFPVRIKCALLPWTTLKEAVDGGTIKNG